MSLISTAEIATECKVCDRWTIFDNFIADMGKRPRVGYSIERKNNDGDRAKTIWIDYRGSKITTLQASKISGLSTNVVKSRWSKGWSAEDIINRPKLR